MAEASVPPSLFDFVKTTSAGCEAMTAARPATAPATSESVPESEASATSGKAASSAADARSKVMNLATTKGTSLSTLAGSASKSAPGPPRASTARRASAEEPPVRTATTRTASNGHTAQATKAVAMIVASTRRGTENRSALPGPAAPRTARPKISTRPKESEPASA
eukprot:scaffold30374_cov107-Isochrysis_galbana.AAC.1